MMVLREMSSKNVSVSAAGDGGGSSQTTKRKYAGRAGQMPIDCVLALVAAQREEQANQDMQQVGSAGRNEPAAAKWSRILKAVQDRGFTDVDTTRLSKKWTNLTQAYRKVCDHEKASGQKSFWDLTTAEKKAKGYTSVSIEHPAFDAMHEWMGDGNAHCDAPNVAPDPQLAREGGTDFRPTEIRNDTHGDEETNADNDIDTRGENFDGNTQPMGTITHNETDGDVSAAPSDPRNKKRRISGQALALRDALQEGSKPMMDVMLRMCDAQLHSQQLNAAASERGAAVIADAIMAASTMLAAAVRDSFKMLLDSRASSSDRDHCPNCNRH